LTLEDAPESRLRMSELAEHIMLSRSGITRLVDRLERDGLLKRHDCVLDRRATYAALTPEGLELRKRMWPIYREGIIELFANKMSEDEAQVLSKVFLRVLEDTPRELLHGMPERCKNAV
jgi:DNA-binding MarR family transcriptional regulator